ncbi:Pentatricopeptide repeat-containing protein At1g51965 [Durusdinium trenchii]|uniref:Mitochondrial n=1 Tax=Durusdinium trenchii TaxID=1381693 RepID=A0ABP0KEE7_9DINO
MPCWQIRRNCISYTAATAAAPWLQVLQLTSAARHEALRLDAFSANQALEATAMSSQWQLCLHGFGEFNHQRLQNNFSCSPVVKAMECISHWPSALHLACRSSRGDRGFGSRAAVLCSALSATGLAGQWRWATELMDALGTFSCRPDLVSYNAGVSAMARSGAWILSFEHLNALEQDGLEADEITWSATITSAEKGHQWSLAFLLLAELLMKSFQLSLIACDATISACEKCGQWEEALAVLELMSQWRLSPSDITYNAAIGACEKGQLRVRASGLVRRQLAAVEDSACRVLKTGELEKKKGRSSKRMGLDHSPPG